MAKRERSVEVRGRIFTETEVNEAVEKLNSLPVSFEPGTIIKQQKSDTTQTFVVVDDSLRRLLKQRYTTLDEKGRDVWAIGLKTGSVYNFHPDYTPLEEVK